MQDVVSSHSDSTFRAYSTAQAQEYAQRRGGYPQRLIEEIITLHAETGGAFESILDIRCGPGSATRHLASYFNSATGIDPSAEMIKIANDIGGNAKESTIQFSRDEAELCQNEPDHSVDLISAATSGHWFDMDRFWPTAARVLRPGGTVAFFTIWRIYCHPKTTPHAEEIQRILIELKQETLGPYQKPGNWSLMGLYEDLKMPWQLSPPCTPLVESSHRRQVWNEHGLPEHDGSYMCGERVMSLDDVEKAIATISAVTRWREAHPNLALTENDCVKAAFAKIRSILQPGGTNKLTMVGPTVLVTVKKGTG